MEKKMSIHQALAEIKTYDDRIARGSQALFIVANKKSNKTPNGMTAEELKAQMKGNLDSVKALIENKKIIKSAVAMSNATTKVNVDGTDYTIVEAIERKNMLQLEKNLLTSVKNQDNNSVSFVDSKNNSLNDGLEKFLQSSLGDKANRTVEVVEQLTKTYYDLNGYELIDPNNLKEVVKDLEKKIETFATDIDYKLSESNATTFITVNLVD